MFRQTTNENKTDVSPKALEEGKSAPFTFKNAPEAYRALLRETLDTLSKEYAKPMSFGEAIVDCVFENNKFSPKKAGILAGSVTIGSIAAMFHYAPAFDTTNTIVKLIKEETGIELPAQDVLSYFLASAACGENGAFSIFSATKMFEHFFGKESEALNYLRPHDSTFHSRLQAQGRNLFDLCAAVATNVPTFLITKNAIGTPLAILTSTSNISISWMGLRNMKLSPDRRHPACILEANYLGEQIDSFLNLPFDEQVAIMNAIKSKDLKSNDESDDYYRKMYHRLLRLPELTINKKADIHDQPIPAFKQKVLSNTLSSIGLVTTSAIRASTYTGITGLFPDPTSPQAIMAALPAVLLSLLPSFGYSLIGGQNAGRDFTTKNKALASLYLPKTRKALEALIGFISIFAGSTIFSIANTQSNKFSDLVGLAGPMKTFLTMLYNSTAATGFSTIAGYYTSKLLDEILIYFALRCADEDVKRLFTFVLEVRKLENSLSQMTKENYLDILKWKMSVNDNTQNEKLITPSESKQEEQPHPHKKNYKRLSRMLENLFDARLTDKGYKTTQDDLRKLNYRLKDREVHDKPVQSTCCGLFHRKPVKKPQQTEEMKNISYNEI